MGKAPVSDAKRRLPQFLGIGAQRAGTTWLDALLRSHSGLFLPRRRKELHYFDKHHARGLAWYAEFFVDAPAKAILGEVTPKYLYDPMVPQRIALTLPGVRLIAILRDPVSRAYSQFGLFVRDNAYAKDFTTFLDERPGVLERGFYHRQLERYREWFERERLCVLVMEAASIDVKTTSRVLGRFLGVKPEGFNAGQTQAAKNASHRVRFARSYAVLHAAGSWMRRHDLDGPVNLAKRLRVGKLFGSHGALPPLDPKLRAKLAAHFADDIARLEADYELDLSSWKR